MHVNESVYESVNKAVRDYGDDGRGRQDASFSNAAVASGPGSAWVTPGMAEGDLETVEESIRLHDRELQPIFARFPWHPRPLFVPLWMAAMLAGIGMLGGVALGLRLRQPQS